MNERQMQFRVGVVVFATMIVGGILMSIYGRLHSGLLPWGTGRYTIEIHVPQAPGVDTNTPVRKNGILIGRVKAIDDRDDGVALRAEIDSNRPLYPEHEPHIRTTVIGDATIDFFSRPPAPGSQRVEDGAVFKGQVDPNPFDSLAQLGDLKEEFSSASRALTEAGNEISKLAKRVNNAFGEEGHESDGRVTRLLDTTERAMRQFENTMTAFNEIVGDVPSDTPQPGPARPPVARPPVTQPLNPPSDFPPPKNQPPRSNQQPAVEPPLYRQTGYQQPVNGQPGAQPRLNGEPGVEPPVVQPPVIEGPEMRRRLREGLNELPDAIKDFRSTMTEFREVLASANTNLKNLEGFTEPLGQKGGDFTEALLKVVDGLDQLVTDFNTVTTALNNRRGTVGRLLYDDGKAYENLNVLMMNANTVLKDLHDLAFRLRPVLDNARIFLDKVATEPGRIISGSLNPSNVK